MPDTAEPVDLQAGSPRKRVDGPQSRAKEAKDSKKKTILPKPKGLRTAPEVFFKWSESFSEEQKGRAVFHVYREYPVIDLSLVGEQKPKLIAQLHGAMGFSSADWQPAILKNREWGGSGGYKIICTEIGVPGAISMCKFTLDDGDWPPVVDPKALVVGHPDNKGYIAGLRARGIRLAGDDPEADRIAQEEEEEMKVAEPLVDHILQENRELREEAREARETQPDPPEESMLSAATSEAVKVVADGAREGFSILGNAVKEATRATAPSLDPIALFEAGRKSSGDGGMAMVTFFMQTMREQTESFRQMHEKTLDYMREKDERREDQPQPAEQLAGVDLLLQEGQKFKQLGELFGWTGRRSRSDEEPAPRQIEPAKESVWEKLFGKLAENPTVLVTGIFAATNLLQTAMGRGKPVEEVIKTANQVAGGMAGTIEPQKQEPTADQLERQRLGNFLKSIEPLFVMHFFDEKKQGLNGYSFAEDFLTAKANAAGQLEFTPEGVVTELGQQQYRSILQAGPIQFDRIIRDYQPIWALAGGNLPKYQQFLKEFFDFPEAAKRAAEERAKKVTTVPTPAS